MIKHQFIVFIMNFMALITSGFIYVQNTSPGNSNTKMNKRILILPNLLQELGHKPFVTLQNDRTSQTQQF